MRLRAILARRSPPEIKKRIKRVQSVLRQALLTFFSLNGFLSSLYYTFFSKSFWREQRAILRARREYWQSLRNVRKSSAFLRRCIHRLEKGLIMRPRRSVFAEGYIERAVESFSTAIQSPYFALDERRWAEDVLTEYFSVVENSPIIQRSRKKFKACNVPSRRSKAIPYQRDSGVPPGLSFSHLLELFKRRRSVRWFEDRVVPRDLIEKAVEAALLAPSACNRQPFELLLANEASRAAEIAKCAMGTAGFADNIPCLLVIVGDLSAFPAERDRHVIYIDGSLMAMQLMLALETLGLSSCALNWPDIEAREQRLADLIDLEYYQRPIMLLAVGYPDSSGGIPFSQKKTVEAVLRTV